MEPNRIYVHYNGWGRRWDEWVDVNSPRIAVFRTYTVGSSTQDYMSPYPVSEPDADLERETVDMNDVINDEYSDRINDRIWQTKECQKDCLQIIRHHEIV